MNSRGSFFLLLAFVLLFSGPAATASAQATEGAAAVSLDFRDVELSDLIKTVSELSGRNFVYDEKVKGKVTIISPQPMSPDEAYSVFLSVLSVKGYTVVPSGKVNKIVALRDAKQTNLPTRTDRAPRGDQFVTRLIPLKNVDATAIANTVLKPLVPKTSHIAAYAPSNTLIITDSASNIERLYQIVKALDVADSGNQLEVLAIEFADAEEVAKICTAVLAQGAAAPRRKGGAPAAAGQSRIIAHPRTNSLVVMATGDELETVRRLVGMLDQKPTQERAGIYVYYLQNADAESLAKTMNEILTGIKAKARTPAKGKQPQAQPLDVVTITADKPTNALVVNATPEDYETIKQIIAKLDVKRKQVFVEVLIMELSMNAVKSLGVSLQGAVGVGDDSVSFGTSNLNTGSASLADLSPAAGGSTPTLLGKAISGILLGGLFNPITTEGPDGSEITIPAFSALIDLSKTDSDVDILAAPRLLTSDNEEAEIVVGSNVPIITQRLTDTGGTGLAQSVSVERQDVALTLRYTPQITEGNLVRLNLYQEITDVAPSNPDVGSPAEVGPTLTKRLLRNTVVVRDAQTAVLGGLISSNVTKQVSKVPLLGDIPLLGWLFRSKSDTEVKTNLVIFITPRIIRDDHDLAMVTRRSREGLDLRQQERLSNAPFARFSQPAGQGPSETQEP